MTTTAHANCDHEATPTARAACRKARHDAALAHVLRRRNVLVQLDRAFGSGNLLVRVCCRYQGSTRNDQDLHVNHATYDDCADAILNAIDHWRNSGDININENDLEHHAYRMFS